MNRTTYSSAPRLFLSLLAFFAGSRILLSTGHVTAAPPEEPVQLDEVVVSATRTPTAAEVAPASVTVVDRKTIERQNVRTVDEAVRLAAGLEIKRSKGVADTSARVQLRGLAGQDRTLVLVDGLPLNNGYTDQVPLNQMAIDNIERIEIIRGPASALYGGNAMGGVVNIITRSPTGLEASARVGYGTCDTQRVRASVGNRWRFGLGARAGFEFEAQGGYATIPVLRPLSAGAATLTGGYATTSTGGTPQWAVGDRGDNWANRGNANLALDWDAAEATRLQLAFQMGWQSYGYGPPHTYVAGTDGAPAWSGAVGAGVNESGQAQKASISPSNFIAYTGPGTELFSHGVLTWEQAWGNWLLIAKAGYQRTGTWYATSSATGAQDYDTSPGSLSDAVTHAWLADVQLTSPPLLRQVFTGGLALRLNDFNQTTTALDYYRDRSTRGEAIDATRGRDLFVAAYVQDELRLRPWLALYGGARLDFWRAFHGRSGNVGSEVDFAGRNDWAVSPKLTVLVTPREGTTLRLSGGGAFRAPTIYELFRTWQSATMTYHSNPALRPETLWNVELGAEQRLFNKRLRLAATAFYSHLFNAIETYTVESKDQYRENVSRARVLGLEAEAEVRIWRTLQAFGSFTLNDTKVLENPRAPEAVGKHLTGAAGTLASLGSSFDHRWFRLATSASYRGRIYTSATNSDVTGVYGAYDQRWLWNGKASFFPLQRERAEVSLSIDNILGTNYFDSGVAPGRTFFAEIAGRY